MDAATLDRLQRVLGVLDENLTTIARELSLMTRIDGTKIVLMGEEAETGGAVIGNAVFSFQNIGLGIIVGIVLNLIIPDREPGSQNQ